jgi:hypothetical protein
MRIDCFVLAFTLCLGVVDASVTFFPAEGYSKGAYDLLGEQVSSVLKAEGTEANVCVAHGNEGLRAITDGMPRNASCRDAVVLLGTVPEKTHITTVLATGTPLLVLAGDLDGVSRFSNFAAAMHKFRSDHVRFALVQGASHHSFASGPSVHPLDLVPEIDTKLAHSVVAALVGDFVAERKEGKLVEAESAAGKLAAPIVAALKLEGSAALGTDICNSDFPTNPTCNYPQYPAFSLPPGPAPAPSPLPSADCICGSQWVTDYAFPEVSGAHETGFKLHVADAFHSVSDVHPFHLPHIWNKCPSPDGCELNVTTLTENLPGSGSLFPNGTGAPLSAYELRTKMKSRTTLYKAVGLKPSANVDKNLTICRRANEEAWGWAMQNAEASVMKRFSEDGEPFVMVDDVEAPIGLHGPEWIEKTLVYNRVKGSTGKSHIEVQSWTFVVGDFPIHTKYLPTGMHYCKLLSPARAMEWIYTDSLRMRRSVTRD